MGWKSDRSAAGEAQSQDASSRCQRPGGHRQHYAYGTTSMSEQAIVISQAAKVLGCVSLKSTRVLPVFKGALVIMRAPVLQQFAKDPSDGSLDC